MADLIWLVPILPLLGVLINGLFVSSLKRNAQQKLAGGIATVLVAGSFVAALVIALNLGAILAGQPYRDVVLYPWIDIPGSLSIPLALRIDPLSVTMMLVVTGVGSLIHLFSIGYMCGDERYTRYFTYLNLFTFAMLLLVLANNYVLMFVGWEGVGLCSYLLIGFWFERVPAAQAGKKAFLINRIGDFGFLLGLFALFWITGSLVFNTPEGTGALDRAGALSAVALWGIPAATVVALLLFVGATGKSAQLPLYLWLPDAMEGPTPVSALIHAATMVTAGVYMIARSAPIYAQSQEAQTIVAAVGIITAFYAAYLALKQYDIKRVLAYSTVSQLGYMFVGVGIGAYAAGISHLITHAFFKALMFLGAGAVMHALDGQLDMRKMGNLRRHLPVTFITFAAGWYAICGLPLGAGFFSKDYVLESALHHGYAWIFWLGVVTAAMTAFYMTRMFITVFFGSERIEMGDEGHGGDAQEHGKSHAPGHAHDHGHDHHGRHAGHAHVHPEQGVMNLPLIVLGIASLVGGFLVVPPLAEFLAPVTTGMVPHVGDAAHAGEHAVEGWSWAALTQPPTWISLGAAVLGVAAALAYGANRFAQGWPPAVERVLALPQNLYEGAMHAIFVRGGTALSLGLYTIVDRQIIDRLVDGTGAFTAYLADSLRTLQTGFVRNYALVMLAGAVFVAICFLLILRMSFGVADGFLTVTMPNLLGAPDAVWPLKIPLGVAITVIAAFFVLLLVLSFRGQQSEGETTPAA